MYYVFESEIHSLTSKANDWGMNEQHWQTSKSGSSNSSIDLYIRVMQNKEEDNMGEIILIEKHTEEEFWRLKSDFMSGPN